MKIKTLTIKDFQSVKNIKIEFSPSGVTRFSGPNNIGKSVILKAINAVMQNISNRNYKEYIRDNEDTFEVIVEDFDGNVVHLSRGDVDFYAWTIDGKEGREDRTGGRVPKAVRDYFNVYIEEEKTKECLNVRLPGDRLLFVDTSAGDNAMLFQRALGTEDYMLGIKRVDKIGRDLKKETKLIEKYLEQEESKLKDVEVELSDLQQSVANIERYEDVLKVEWGKLEKVFEVEKDTEDYVTLKSEITTNKEILKELRIDQLGKEIEGIKHLKEMSEIEEDVRGLRNNIKKLKAIKVDTELGKDLGVLQEIQEVITVQTEVDSLAASVQRMVDIEVDVGLEEELRKLDNISNVEQIYKEVVKGTKGIKEKKEQYQKIKKELLEVEDELGYCPTCGTAFGRDTCEV